MFVKIESTLHQTDTTQFDTCCVRETIASNSFITWPPDHR